MKHGFKLALMAFVCCLFGAVPQVAFGDPGMGMQETGEEGIEFIASEGAPLDSCEADQISGDPCALSGNDLGELSAVESDDASEAVFDAESDSIQDAGITAETYDGEIPDSDGDPCGVQAEEAVPTNGDEACAEMPPEEPERVEDPAGQVDEAGDSAQDDSESGESEADDMAEAREDSASEDSHTSGNETDLLLVNGEESESEPGNGASDANSPDHENTSVGVSADATEPESVSDASTGGVCASVQASASSSSTTAADADAAIRPQTASTEKHAAEVAGLVNGHVYLLVSSLSSGNALQGAYEKVLQQAATRIASQQWRLAFAENDCITLTNLVSSRKLGVASLKPKESLTVNALLQSALSTGTARWSVVRNADGTYSLVLVSTVAGENQGGASCEITYAITANGASATTGARPTLKEFTGAGDQKWVLVDATAMWQLMNQKARNAIGSVPSGTYFMVPGHTKMKVMNVAGTSKASGGNVSLWGYGPSQKQCWKVTVNSKGYATITSVYSGNVLSIAGAKAVSGANVVHATMAQYVSGQSPNAQRAQRWIITMNSDGTYRIASALWDGLVLEVAGSSVKNGANVRVAKACAGASQKWDLFQTKPKVAKSVYVKEGWYYLRSYQNAKLNLDVKGNEPANGTKLQLWTKSTSTAQAFYLKKVGDYYRIGMGTDRIEYLQVRPNWVIPGADVREWNSLNNSTLYSLVKNGNGSYRFINVASGLAISIAGGKAVQEADITSEKPKANAAAQSFVMVSRHGLLENGIYRVTSDLADTRVVSVAGGSSAKGARMKLNEYDKAFSQKWKLTGVKDRPGVYTLESLGSGYLLHCTSKGVVSQQAANGNTSQMWRIERTRKSYVLKNVLTGKALTLSSFCGAEGSGIKVAADRGVLTQRFWLSSVPAVDSGWYEFLCSGNTGLALDVAGGTDVQNENVQLWARNKKSAQRFYYDAETGTISAMCSMKLLDSYGAKAVSGSNVVQHTDNGGTNQRWTIAYAGKGRFRVVSDLGSSLVLSADAASKGSNVVNATNKNVGTQRWKLVRHGTVQVGPMRIMDAFVSNGHGSLYPSYVCIHETATPGAPAVNLKNYWMNNPDYAVHYTLDWKGDCYYCVPENRLCWQVGYGNPYVVGVELCHATNQADFDKVYAYGVKWAAWQLGKRGWGVDRLISHYECTKRWGGSDHTDPVGYFASYGTNWAAFKRDVANALAGNKRVVGVFD